MLNYIEETFSNPTFYEPRKILEDETDSERDSLIDLVFTPDIPTQCKLEPLIEKSNIDRRIESRIKRYLLEQKGYLKEDIQIDADIELIIDGEVYRSQIDLVVSTDGGKTRFMAIRCAAGSLGSREREIIAAARLLDAYQIPRAVVSDGKTAVVLDTVAGKKIGDGLDAIPARQDAADELKSLTLTPFPNERREREKLIFRTFDLENVNVQRNI